MAWFARPTLASLVIGFMVVFLGESLRFWGVAIAGSETRTTDRVGGTYLITTGPFAYVRNPLYVGNVMMYVGFGLMSLALFPWLQLGALFFFLWQYSMIVSLEEEHLAEKFGEDYLKFRESVPRFFPTFNKYVTGNHPQPPLSLGQGLRSEKRTLQAVVLLTTLLVVIWRMKE